MKFTRHKYPDGSIYASIDNYDPTGDTSPIIIGEPINNYEDLWYILCLKDAADNMGLEAILVIPCMWEQQADRRFAKNESFGVRLVCGMINKMNFKKVYVFHPHSDVTPALLERCEVIRPNEFLANVLQDFAVNPIVLSPDAGAFKWIFKELEGLNVEIETGSKVREGSKLVNVINRQDFGGQDVLIVDDMCIYGGTFMNIAKLLQDRNIGRLYLAVSHITVPNPNVELEKYFTTIYTTDSKGFAYTLDNIKIIE